MVINFFEILIEQKHNKEILNHIYATGEKGHVMYVYNCRI